MRGDAVRDLALRAVDDNDAWTVLEDLLEQEPRHRLLVAKLIFRKWPRRWDLAMRCWIWRPGPLASMAAVLRSKYSVASLPRGLYAESPLFKAIPKRAPFVTVTAINREAGTVTVSPSSSALPKISYRDPGQLPVSNRKDRRAAAARSRHG